MSSEITLTVMVFIHGFLVASMIARLKRIEMKLDNFKNK